MEDINYYRAIYAALNQGQDAKNQHDLLESLRKNIQDLGGDLLGTQYQYDRIRYQVYSIQHYLGIEVKEELRIGDLMTDLRYIKENKLRGTKKSGPTMVAWFFYFHETKAREWHGKIKDSLPKPAKKFVRPNLKIVWNNKIEFNAYEKLEVVPQQIDTSRENDLKTENQFDAISEQISAIGEELSLKTETAKNEIKASLERIAAKSGDQIVQAIVDHLKPSIDELTEEETEVAEKALIEAAKGDRLAASRRLADQALGLKNSTPPKLEQAASLYKAAATLVSFHEWKMAKRYFYRAYEIKPDPTTAIQLAYIFSYLGHAELKSRNYAEAIRFYKDALFFYRKNNTKHMIPTTLGDLGTAYLEQGEIIEAEKYLKDAVIGNLSVGNKHSLAIALNNLGQLNLNKRFYQEAFTNFIRASETFSVLTDGNNEALSMCNAGISAMHCGQFSRAEKALSRAAYIFNNIQNYSGLVRAKYLLGNVHVRNEKLNDAISLMSEAIEISELQLGKTDASALANYATTIAKTGNTEVAISKMNSALAIFIAENDKAGQAGAYGSLGVWQTQNKEFTEAENMLLQSKEMHSKLSLPNEALINLQNLVDLYSMQNKTAELKPVLLEIIELAQNPEQLELRAIALFNMGGVLFNERQFVEAESFAFRARLIFDHLKHPSLLAQTDVLLSSIAHYRT